jgi:hypothetical protein
MNTCVYSSLVFLTNAVAAYLTGEYIYGMARIDVQFHFISYIRWK